MARPMFDSEHIFGIHEPGGEAYMRDAGRPGWILFTEGIGSDPQNFSSADYREYSNQGFGILCRLNNGYHPDGTIPHSSRYGDFAIRCANFVANSRGCKIWIIGNEMNYEIERPSAFAATDVPAMRSLAPADDEDGHGQDDVAATVNLFGRFFNRLLVTISRGMGDAELGTPPSQTPEVEDAFEEENDSATPNDDPLRRSDPSRFSALNEVEASDVTDDTSDGPSALDAPAWRSATQVITPALYADCYRRCRDAIHAVPGHEDDQVLIGAVAPWNNQTTYEGNANGDWVQYFQDILELLGKDGCDGITVHTYTHQADPNLIHSDAKMNPPFENYHYEFRAYQDFMGAVPADMRQLPLYITETDQDVAWLDSNTTWVQRAYGEIDYWNRQAGNQQIRSLVLYRWPVIDRWYIEGKNGVIADFRDALQYDYRWRPAIPPADFAAGDLLSTTDLVNLRRTPGYQNKPADDLLTTLPVDALIRVVNDEYVEVDGLIWWQVDTVAQDEIAQLRGWLAQNSPAGIPLVRKVDTSVPEGEIGIGSTVRTLTIVRMRKTPGTVNKPADDVIAEVPAGNGGPVIAGPEAADGLVWWRIRTTDGNDSPIEGWMAEADQAGNPLLEVVEKNGGGSQPEHRFEVGDTAVTLDIVRVRHTPGYADKDETDIVMDSSPGTLGEVLAGPEELDGLVWWYLSFRVEGDRIRGWAAETAPNGVELLGLADEVITPSPDDAYRIGELVQAATHVRIRRTPGYSHKPADDVLGAFGPQATLNILAGPRDADGLTWWRVGGISPQGERVGWVAETAPNSVPLMQRPPKLPGTNIPDPASKTYLGAPYRRRFGISQLWGENPQIYGQFTYDGVPLQGHNGIDFLTPHRTDLLAVDDGQVLEVIYYDMSGFGHYVKVQHSWGESIYAHMDDIIVAPGATVRRGDLVGHSDNTGYSGGPHLHFAIRINPYERTDGWGGFSDPLPYMDPDDFQLPSYVTGASMVSDPLERAAAPAPPGSATHGVQDAGVGMAPDHPQVTRP